MTSGSPDRDSDVVLPGVVPFVAVHLAALAAPWTGVTADDLVLCAVLYLVRMWGVGAGYHRYFAHRSFKTGRAFQLLLALLAQTSGQKGVLWWAAAHRRHHAWSDTGDDLHSPRHHGFWYAHLGWAFVRRNYTLDYAGVPDLARYPELVWLDRHPYFAPTLLAAAVFAAAGPAGLVVGFAWSTVLLYHAIFLINSLGHLPEAGGKAGPRAGRQWPTGDDSRNSLPLALITLGEGWHNNHHFVPAAARHGLRWWQIDPTWAVLRLLAGLGLVWDLRRPPAGRLGSGLPRPAVAPPRQLAAGEGGDGERSGGGVEADVAQVVVAVR